MSSFLYRKEVLYQFIRKWLKTHPRANYFQRIWRYRNDGDFVTKVLQINNNPDIIEVKRFGEKNLEKNIYFIDIGGVKRAGLGGYLRQTLYGLYEADRMGFIPVVYYRPEGCIYAETEQINGTKNPFEYYFKQPAHLSVAEVYESARVLLYNPSHSLRVEYDLGNLEPESSARYIVNDVFMREMARVFKQYIHLKPVVQEKIFEDMRQLTPDGWERQQILGVHIRGTDYALNWVNHPKMVTVDEFMQAIDEIMARRDYKYIFLATDDKRRLEVLRAKYDSKLIYYKDVFRGENELNIAMEQSDRPLHHYLSGLEVLRDMYTLAHCDSLVCGLSQISIAARIIHFAGDAPYTYLKVLDKGIYQG